MAYFVTGVIIFVVSIGGWWLSLPSSDGQIKPFARNGNDVWIAVAVTMGSVMGIGALVVGILELVGKI